MLSSKRPVGTTILNRLVGVALLAMVAGSLACSDTADDDPPGTTDENGENGDNGDDNENPVTGTSRCELLPGDETSEEGTVGINQRIDINSGAGLVRYQNVTQINGNLYIYLNEDESVDCVEFPNLRVVTGVINIIGAGTAVETVNFPVLQKAGGVSIDEVDVASEVSVLREVHMENLLITEMPMAGGPRIGDMRISSTTSLETFSAPLLETTGDVYVGANDALQSLDLASLNEASRLAFFQNPELCLSAINALVEQVEEETPSVSVDVDANSGNEGC
ncbi:hypothetical protein FRC96_12415 [Lujinxingia vulgaris]|uniref:Uncharacterized protein n=1 Tax=Lujinxingia vulgaris TaxID=2600176 RepID=A0A5C6X7Z8_9DELT|nr:hypothetical protein [Lujinxingia vulgaris]TXD34857.1 hypothetical protein FRC96_12415 [Lujinxingia vulgaris]